MPPFVKLRCVSPFNEPGQLLLQLPLPSRLLQVIHTSQIIHDIARLSEIDLMMTNELSTMMKGTRV